MNNESVVEGVETAQDLDSLLLPVVAQTEDPQQQPVQQQVQQPVHPPIATGGPVNADAYAYQGRADTDEYKRSYAMNFNVRKKPKSLFVMTLGMAEFNGILDRPPLSIVKRKELNEAYVPKADDFKHEVKRRAHFFMNVEEDSTYFTEELKRPHPLKTRRNKVALPQPNQWLNSNLKKWLVDRPMKPNDNDIKFLRTEVNRALTYLSTESIAEAGDPEVSGVLVPETPKNEVAMASPALAPPTTPAIASIDTEPYSYIAMEDNDEFKRSSAQTYLQMEAKPRIIIAMALGMEEYDGLLDRPPFSIARRKDLTDDYMPRAEDYRFEIKRRAHFFSHSEGEAQYFATELKRKHPLENMRGVVTSPQPAQWKIQALRGWLSERPLKPNKQDSDFIAESIQRILDALQVVVDADNRKLFGSSGKKPAATKLPWGTADSSVVHSMDKESLLLECITRQDAILGAVTKQTNQQAILNKISVLNQGISGRQHEISSLRSTLNDLENRILTVELKIAENPGSEERLTAIAAKQSTAKAETEAKIKELQDAIESDKQRVDELTTEMDEVMEEESEPEPLNIRKRKHEEQEEEEEPQGDVKAETQENGVTEV